MLARNIESVYQGLLGAEFLRAISVRHLPVAGSTNSTIKSWLAHSALERPTLLSTDSQLGGRGTRGREWHMQLGRDIALTLAVPYAVERHSDPRLSLAVGGVVAQALEQAAGISLGVKWPNDVLAETAQGWRKCGGVLLETASDPRSLQRWLLAGVGVNVNAQPAQFPPEIAEHAASLAHVAGRELPREALGAAVAQALARLLLGAAYGAPVAEPADAGLNAALAVWHARDQTGGARYTLHRAGADIAVTAQAVDPTSGALICIDDAGNKYSVESYTELS